MSILPGFPILRILSTSHAGDWHALELSPAVFPPLPEVVEDAVMLLGSTHHTGNEFLPVCYVTVEP